MSLIALFPQQDHRKFYDVAMEESDRFVDNDCYLAFKQNQTNILQNHKIDFLNYGLLCEMVDCQLQIYQLRNLI